MSITAMMVFTWRLFVFVFSYRTLHCQAVIVEVELHIRVYRQAVTVITMVMGNYGEAVIFFTAVMLCARFYFANNRLHGQVVMVVTAMKAWIFN